MKSIYPTGHLAQFWNIFVFVTSAALASSPPDATAGPTDHLIPPTSEIDAAYRTLLSQKLFVTPANYARVVIMPSSSAGETAIAIYSGTQASGQRNVFLTCTKADTNLWYSVSPSNPSRGTQPSIKVTRTDAPFPSSAALAVSAAFDEMIARTKPLEPGNRIVVDGTNVEFEVQRGAQTSRRGLLTPYAKGQFTQALHRLTELLTNYCDAGPGKREQLAREVEAEANQLVQAVHRQRPKVQ